MQKRRTSRLTTRSYCRAPAGGADVPTTVLFGRRWPSDARRSIERLARRLARQLGHDVEACDLDASDEPLRLVARRAAARGAMHLVLLPLALDEDSEPEPDVAVVPRDPRAYRDGHPTGAALIVEIADASYRIDHAYKASLYARAGVPEYWIVDLARETLEVHREPQAVMSAPPGWRYLSLEVLRPPATISSLLAPTTSIPVADLLP